MSNIFHLFLYNPLLNLLILLYNTAAFHDLGVAIILLTIIVRLLLYPLFYKMFENQTVLQHIQPEIKRIQEQHKDNQQEQMKAMMELYKHHNVNPFSSFFLILAQLPILIALYQLFLSGLKDGAMAGLYAFVSAPEHINQVSMGLISLQEKSIVIVILAAVVQYYQSMLALPSDPKAKETQQYKIGKQMAIIGPILTIVILGSLPSAVGVYWLTSSIFSVVQQKHINKAIINPYGDTSRDNQKNV